MRELTGHKVNGCNDALTVKVHDEPGHGGASHEYSIDFPDKNGGRVFTSISFQNGPIKEVGTNGVTHESLLAILIDRLEGFQSGQYACDENHAALSYLVAAQNTLKNRTAARLARGVEGTHAV